MSDKVIEVINLSFRYKKDEPLIEDLNFEVRRGEFFGILGPNGAGKSTLLRLILGFLKPQSGEIRLFGQGLDSFSQWKRVGYVPQRFAVEKAFFIFSTS